MADQLIANTPTGGHRLLGIHGQSVVEAHRQLAAVLRSQLGPEHAAYFARPQLDPRTGSVDWYADAETPVVKLTQLAPEERIKLEQRAARLRADIAAFAIALKKEGSSAELVGRMLEAALNVPPGDWLHAAGRQPVTILWGHELADSAPLPAPPPLPPSATVPPAVAAAMAPAGTVGRAWWVWLLPLLLLSLLLLLGLRACEPLPAQIVPGPDVPDPDNPLPTEEARNRALREELDRLAAERNQELAMCVLPEPERPIDPAKELPPEPATTEPVTVPPHKPAAQMPAEQPKSEPPKREQARPQPQPQPQRQSEPATPCRTDFPPGEEPEVIVVVDSSGSMAERMPGNRTRMDAAKSSIEHVVNGLPEPITVGLVEFTNCNAVRRDRFYTAPERGQLIGEVGRLAPAQGTPLAGGIRRAGDIASADAEAVIVVVSDGDDSCGGDPCAEARAIKAKKPNVKINVIDLSGDAKSSAVMQCIAAATGGRVLKPNSAAELDTVMQRATEQADLRQCKP